MNGLPPFQPTRWPRWATLSAILSLSVAVANAADLHVMKTGLGDGTIAGTGISCGVVAGTVSTDCSETGIAPTTTVTLTVTVGSGAQFTAWGGDCASVPATTLTCDVPMSALRRVRANFDLLAPIETIASFTPDGIDTYLEDHPEVDTPAEFLAALPQDFRQNWILMVRSESLQTGTAALPRFLLPSEDATRVFTFGVAPAHASYPGAHPSAIEYMQYDDIGKNFHFHEIVIVPEGEEIPAMGDDLDPDPAVVRRRYGPRPRGVTADDQKCFACHSTRNVINLNPARDGPGTTPGTTGTTPQTIKFKNKPQ